MALVLFALAAVQPLPDISLHATVDARSARVESRGEASLSVNAEPEGGSLATSSGSANSTHWELRLDARIAPLLIGEAPAETEPSLPR